MISKFAGLVREFGFGNAVVYAFGLAVAAVFPRIRLYRYYIVAQPVAEKDHLPPRRGRAIDVREMKPGDPGFADLPIDDDMLDFRFGQDVVCLGAFQDGRAIGCLWMCFGAFEEDEVRCVFDLRHVPRASWDFAVYLDPDARLGFGFLRLWDEANAVLRARGIAWSMSRISAFNPGSLASHARMKATRTGSLTAITGPRRQLVFSSVAPWIVFGRHDRKLPRYPLLPPAGTERR